MIGIIFKWYHKSKMRKALKNGLQVGQNCKMYGAPNFGSEPYLIRIGDNVEITSGVTFLTHDGSIWVLKRMFPEEDINKYGKIIVGNNVFIGTKSTIMPNVTIGDNSVIGAGSVVTKDVPSNTIVAGNPAKVICSIEEYLPKVREGTLKKEINKGNLIKHFWGA